MITIKDCDHQESIKIDFTPTDYKTPANAAKALYKEICKAAKSIGQNPDIEVALLNPEQSAKMGTGKNWRVVWEAGLYQWAIGFSFQCHNSPHWYTEPYYSFDVCFAQ